MNPGLVTLNDIYDLNHIKPHLILLDKTCLVKYPTNFSELLLEAEEWETRASFTFYTGEFIFEIHFCRHKS